MVFVGHDVETLQMALRAAEAALRFAHPHGLDKANRDALAREIVPGRRRG